jgi:hypothetical protein
MLAGVAACRSIGVCGMAPSLHAREATFRARPASERQACFTEDVQSDEGVCRPARLGTL